MHTAHPLNVGLYLRISRDDGTTLAVERQEAECRARAEQLGWHISKVYTDQGKSASKSSVTRDLYNQMLSDARSGAIQGLIAWSMDRLTRQPDELTAWLDLADRGFQIATTGGILDLATPGGRMTARVLAAVAEQEVRQKGARQKASNRQRAELGLPLSRQRAFGYLPDNMTVDPVESVMIREAVEGLIAGTHSINGITNSWNRSEVPTTYGNKWKSINVKRILTSDRIAGILRYQGKELFKAQWQAIITPEQLETVRATFDGNSAPTQGNKARNLLSYIMRCECGEYVVAMSGARKVLTYRCSAVGHFTSIRRDIADDVVLEAVAERLSSPGYKPPAAVQSIADLRQSLLEVNAETQTLEAMYEKREITLAQFSRMNKGSADERVRLEDEIAQLMERDAVARLINGLVLRSVNTKVLANSWGAIRANHKEVLERLSALDVEQKRTVIRGLFTTITLHRSSGGRQSVESMKARVEPQ